MRKKLCWVFLATLVLAAPASAQTQVETAFEVGLGYGKPAVRSILGSGGFDMATLLIQSDDYLFESGIALGFGADNTVFGWMIRGAARPLMIGNVLVHTGAEFSLFTNSTLDADGAATLIGLGFMFGVSHQVTDHINGSVNVYPLSFSFGGADTLVDIGRATFGAHFLF
jgi:hypothetical protein